MHRSSIIRQFSTALIAVVGLVIVVGLASPVSAADIYVNRTADLYNGNCIIACSLRDAILVSNANGEDDTIHVPAGNYSLTIPPEPIPSGTAGDLYIDSPDVLTIVGEGPGVTFIDGNAIDRVFRIHTFNGPVVLKGMTIQGGNPAGSGGGIFNWNANLFIISCEITGNHVNAADRQGGGIFNQEGVLWIDDSVISNNSSAFEAGGLYMGPGSTNQITRSAIYDNTAASVGGVYTEGTSYFYNVTVFYNEADDNLDGVKVEGTATFRHTTLYHGPDPTDISLYCKAVGSEAILQNTIIYGVCDVFEATIDAQQGNIELGDTCYLDYGDYANAGDGGVGLYHFGFNGGAVPTMKLQDSSWAKNNQWTTTYLLDHDARFVGRPVGTYGDSGAYELVPGEIFSHGFETGYTTGWFDTVQ